MRMLTIGELHFLDETIFESYKQFGVELNAYCTEKGYVSPIDESGDFSRLILKECYALECVVQNPDLLKELERIFIKSRKQSYLRLFETTVQEYNIIHNFDRNEEYSDEITGTATGNNTTNETGSGTGKQENKSATFQNPVHLKIADQIENTANNTTERTDETSQTATTNVKHTAHLFGNIGVTTTQQMLKEEREILEYSFIQHIVDEFKREFCIMIY